MSDHFFYTFIISNFSYKHDKSVHISWDIKLQICPTLYLRSMGLKLHYPNSIFRCPIWINYMAHKQYPYGGHILLSTGHKGVSISTPWMLLWSIKSIVVGHIFTSRECRFLFEFRGHSHWASHGCPNCINKDNNMTFLTTS